jgi:hypothetical protein
MVNFIFSELISLLFNATSSNVLQRVEKDITNPFNKEDLQAGIV